MPYTGRVLQLLSTVSDFRGGLSSRHAAPSRVPAAAAAFFVGWTFVLSCAGRFQAGCSFFRERKERGLMAPLKRPFMQLHRRQDHEHSSRLYARAIWCTYVVLHTLRTERWWTERRGRRDNAAGSACQQNTECGDGVAVSGQVARLAKAENTHERKFAVAKTTALFILVHQRIQSPRGKKRHLGSPRHRPTTGFPALSPGWLSLSLELLKVSHVDPSTRSLDLATAVPIKT